MSESKDKVVQERIDLNEKRKKLIDFIQNNSRFREFSDEHQMLLRLQSSTMEIYSSVLRERILLFGKEEAVVIEKTPA